MEAEKTDHTSNVEKVQSKSDPEVMNLMNKRINEGRYRMSPLQRITHIVEGIFHGYSGTEKTVGNYYKAGSQPKPFQKK